MAHRCVLVHSCFSSQSVGAVSLSMAGKKSEKIFVSFPNASCRCQKYISRDARNERLAHGEIYVILRNNAASQPVPEWNEVVEAGKDDRTPRSPTIEEAHIERAYVTGNADQREAEQNRIEAYNVVTQEALCGLGAFSRARGSKTPAVPRERTLMPPGDACVTSWADMRTGS